MIKRLKTRYDFLEVVSHLLTFSHFFFRLTVLNNITGGADLAVLQLDRPAVFSDTVWPVCLPAPSDSILLEEVIGFHFHERNSYDMRTSIIAVLSFFLFFMVAFLVEFLFSYLFSCFLDRFLGRVLVFLFSFINSHL